MRKLTALELFKSNSKRAHHKSQLGKHEMTIKTGQEDYFRPGGGSGTFQFQFECGISG